MRSFTRLSFKGIGVPFVLLVSLLFSMLASPTSFAAHTTAAHLRLTPDAGPPTTQVQVVGKGFGPGETVVVTFDKEPLLEGAVTGNDGTFSTRIQVPTSATPGNHTVQATGQSSGLSAQAIFLVQTNWPFDGFGLQRTGYNPYENVLSSSNVSQLQLAWSSSYVVGYSVEVNGTLYSSSSGGVVNALNAQTGALQWSYSSSDLSPVSPPAVAHDTVYVGGGREFGGHMFALDARSGTLKWTYTLREGGVTTAPVVVNDTLYFTSYNQDVYALDAQTGALKWSLVLGDNVRSPAVDNGIVYLAGEFGGDVVALDARTGARIWDTRIGPYIFSTPTVANGMVYIASSAGPSMVYALDAQTGAIKWSRAFQGFFNGYESAAVAYGTVYIFTDNGRLHALDAQTGKPKWTYITHSSSFGSRPAVAGGVLYFSAGGGLYALDAKKGTLLWSYDAGGSSFQIVTNGMLFAGQNAFHLPNS